MHRLEKEWHTLQCSCLENPVDRGVWWAAIYGVAQSQTRLKQLSSNSRMHHLGEHGALACKPKEKLRSPASLLSHCCVYSPLRAPPHPSGGSAGKESACNAGDSGLIPGLGNSSGEGNGYPLQCSCLENSMERGAWRATVHGSQRVGVSN